MSGIDKILKASKTKLASKLSKSKFFDTETSATPVPVVNLALSGSFKAGISSGLLMVAGPSKHFKSNLALMIAASYLRKHEDATLIFYDSEFGSKAEYFRSFGIDPDRVAHIPIESVEALRTESVNHINAIERGEKYIMVIDSLGNSASEKEIKDAEDGSNKADMTRAKVIKSTFRILTPKLKIKDIPCIAINHTYQTMEMYSKTVASGGTGVYYSSDDVWFLGRRQAEEGKEQGYDFVINVDKSRTIKEGSKLIFSVRWNGGIKRMSGMFDLAVESGCLLEHSPKKSWYQPFDPDTGELIGEAVYGKKKLTDDIYMSLIKQTKFAKIVENNYKLPDEAFSFDEEEKDEGDSIDE